MPKVVIIGGGVSGLTASHELIERGFDVELYESKPIYLGGKARSEDALKTGPNYLPGEHGFRFFPGFYRHLTNTLKRIPSGSGNCLDNLVPTDNILFARVGQSAIFANARFPFSTSGLQLIFQTINGGIANTGLTSAEKTFFEKKIFQLATSCQARFDGEYENTAWWDFMDADLQSNNFKTLLVDGLTRTLVAAKAREMNTKVGGSIILQLLYCLADPALPPSRVLNGPTNEKWLVPWVNYLKTKGVKFFQNFEAEKLNAGGGKITSVQILDKNIANSFDIAGDYYLLAIPVEQAVKLITPAITAIDPSLSTIADLALNVRWMNGIQYFLNADVPINRGHTIYIDSGWSITSISQTQFWGSYNLSTHFNGTVKCILSVDISDWEDGLYNGKRAKDCTDKEIAEWTYEQIQNALGSALLPVNMYTIVEAYHIGSSLFRTPTGLINNEPLLVNKVNTSDLMPKAYTSLGNLFIAGDYARTHTGLATMEAANESARRAVNSIINKSGVAKPFASVWKLRQLPLALPYKWWDRRRYNKGLPHSANYPWWLLVIAFLWIIPCLIWWGIRFLIYYVLGFTI